MGYALEIVDDKSVASFNASLMGEYKFWDFLKLSSLFSYKTHSDTMGILIISVSIMAILEILTEVRPNHAILLCKVPVF